MATTTKARKATRKAYEGPTAEEKLCQALVELMGQGRNPWRNMSDLFHKICNPGVKPQKPEVEKIILDKMMTFFVKCEINICSLGSLLIIYCDIKSGLAPSSIFKKQFFRKMSAIKAT